MVKNQDTTMLRQRVGYYTPARRQKARLVEALNQAHCRARVLRESDVSEAKVIQLGKVYSVRALQIARQLRIAPEWGRECLLEQLEEMLRRDIGADQWLAQYDRAENQHHLGIDKEVREATALVEDVEMGDDDGPEPPTAA